MLATRGHAPLNVTNWLNCRTVSLVLSVRTESERLPVALLSQNANPVSPIEPYNLQ